MTTRMPRSHILSLHTQILCLRLLTTNAGLQYVRIHRTAKTVNALIILLDENPKLVSMPPEDALLGPAFSDLIPKRLAFMIADSNVIIAHTKLLIFFFLLPDSKMQTALIAYVCALACLFSQAHEARSACYERLLRESGCDDSLNKAICLTHMGWSCQDDSHCDPPQKGCHNFAIQRSQFTSIEEASTFLRNPTIALNDIEVHVLRSAKR